jgi:hypothetical protein
LMAESDVLQGEFTTGSEGRQEQKQEVFEHNRRYRQGCLTR